MQSNYKAFDGLSAQPFRKLPASPIRAYQDVPRQLAALTLVLAESRPQEGSGAYRGG